MRLLLLFFIAFIALSCDSQNNPASEGPQPSPAEQEISFYVGADLSYVNEMLDCGAKYKTAGGQVEDPYRIFAQAGTNLVRVRLWHHPRWTDYSNLADVKKTLKRAKDAGMHTLLDFHYSDTWADPEKQEIPAAWETLLNDVPTLADTLYAYTYSTLMELKQEGIVPQMVQVGNEINGEILRHGEPTSINWQRNATLINKGIAAVRDFSKNEGFQIQVMLHIAQPENALWWFKEAFDAGVLDYDIIGLSYYPLWSEFKLDTAGKAFKKLIGTYNKKLIVVETAYPFTLQDQDGAGNILDEDALVEGYPATPQGQLDYLLALAKIIKTAGGDGLVYWEPAWVSTPCHTLWGQGSHWDNVTLFDKDVRANKAMDFYARAGKE
ncbi:MAG: arabinogalactan endo-1,4-beta-galactosidase [Cytophagaceae bacterium]|mgnify:FL=1|nr:arabinogalactan endo-1,4-beta-galactosidase [Cytophagaceae bacterium]|tara:strand:- start:9965 stop:11104 length:1140 start_codon:yes stop_codon:yes gene_type:complete